jgi:tetratricopeptide (TPR) repeat protein
VLLVERLAAAYLQLRDYPAAVDAFQTVLADTPNNLTCLLGLARCMLALQNPGQALIHTNDALEVRHNTADAHYLRAVALLGLRRPLEAAEALKLAIALNPRHPEARQKLATLARNLHGDPQRADHSRQQELPAHQNPTSTCSTSDSGMSRRVAVSCSRPSHEQYPLNPLTLTHPISESIVVVTGLPRSGTAMMLQVLAAGGLPVRISEFRAPDPRYTPEPSRELASLAGHAVRLLSPGIQHLPEAGGLNYGVILMLREISDILRSQHHILARLGKPLEAPEAEQIAASWKNQLLNIRQSLAARGIPILPLEYKHCLLDPRGTAIAIQNFLNTPLDIEAMAREIQPVFAGGKPPAVPVR